MNYTVANYAVNFLRSLAKTGVYVRQRLLGLCKLPKTNLPLLVFKMHLQDKNKTVLVELTMERELFSTTPKQLVNTGLLFKKSDSKPSRNAGT